MISKRTIFSVLLMFLLGCSIRVWAVTRTDVCTAYLSGERNAPSTQIIEVGGRPVEIPCEQWWPRQPQLILLLCLADAMLAVVVIVSMVDDRVRAWERKQAASEQRAALKASLAGEAGEAGEAE